jgi:hypothetical protein
MNASRPLIGLSFAAAVAAACAASGTKDTGPAADAGLDVAVDPDAQPDVAAPKTCVDTQDIKIVRGSPDPQAPDDMDCDPSGPASANTCRFGKCAGWTDPSDGTTHGKCISTCTEVNRQVGQVCWGSGLDASTSPYSAICRTFGTSSYCIPSVVPLCSADGGAPRSPDGGCFKRGATCIFDDDCCSGTCTAGTSGAKCE